MDSGNSNININKMVFCKWSFTTIRLFHQHTALSCCPIHSYVICCRWCSRLTRHYDLQNKVCRRSQGDSVKLVSTSSPPPLLCLVLHPPRVRAAILAETRETLTDKRRWSKYGENRGGEGLWVIGVCWVQSIGRTGGVNGRGGHQRHKG